MQARARYIVGITLDQGKYFHGESVEKACELAKKYGYQFDEEEKAEFRAALVEQASNEPVS